MTTVRQDDSTLKRVTLPYIGRVLKDSGIELKRDGKAYYASLAQERDMIVGLQNSKLTVAVALPVNEEEIDNVRMLADLTMASTMMTKVFLTSGDDGMNMWFAIDTFCKTRGQFEEIFGLTFKQLLQSVRKYISIRNEIEKEMQAEAMVSYLMERQPKGQPS